MQQILPIQAQRHIEQHNNWAAQQCDKKQTIWYHFQWTRLGLPLLLIGLIFVWHMVVVVGNYKPFILPSPLVVFERLIAVAKSGMLWGHVQATLSVALGGFFLSLIIALVLGYVMAHNVTLERTLSPILAGSQAIPILAVAPLIVLWFDTGWVSRILVATIITFFPMLLSTIAALHSIPRELREVTLMSGANRWEMFRYVELPLALPVFFGGVRTGLSLATTGAVVAEFVAGRQGLGAMITIARGLFDTPLIFVALIMLASVTLVLYVLASLLERALVRWNV